MPPHLHYMEPYFGGGAVLFAKQYEGVSEVVNDLNAKSCRSVSLSGRRPTRCWAR